MWQKKWVMGNWKMNGRLASNHALLKELLLVDIPATVAVGIAMPTPYIAFASEQVKGSSLLIGSEDISHFAKEGAFTGEVNGNMLADVGASFVLVGHSERRQYFQESDACLIEKMNNAHAAGLIPILCIGESLAERKSGLANDVIAKQLQMLKHYVGADHVAVAYEPVWAIGTGEVASVEQIRDMHAFIRAQILSLLNVDVTIRLLYGGSVNAKNAADIFDIEHVHGALVGGASLECAGFSQIIQDAQ